MDSLSQIALGSAVGLVAMGRRTAPWKAALWGAVAGTLPDLDVLIDHGDPIRNMVLHRAETHALFWLTLFALPFGALVARLSGEWDRRRRWCWAMGLVLVTHPLLDGMTVYGTRLGLPFTNHPFAVGSVFIIDPLYTLALTVGVVWALRRGNAGPGWRANVAGLTLSTLYLAWGVLAQALVTDTARQALAAQGIRAEHLLVTPTPFNTLLWRVLVVDGAYYHEGFRSLLDAEPAMHFDRFERGSALAAELQGIEGVRRLQAFSLGFWALWEQGGGEGSTMGITDLRMGQEPHYSFRFAVARRHSPPRALPVAVQLGGRPDLGRGLTWLWRRALGAPWPPPR